MNVFRFFADLIHVFAMIVLLLQILQTRSCDGISGKSQVLYALVFTTRYLDILINCIPYNTMMKIALFTMSWATVGLVYHGFKSNRKGTNEKMTIKDERDQNKVKNRDSFEVKLLLVPTILLAIWVNHEFSVCEILWTLSIYLESVAMLPQMYIICKTGEADSIILFYLFLMGSYRALYIVNWIYRYIIEYYYDLIVIAGGVVQTVIYCIFFGLYFTKGEKGKSICSTRWLEDSENEFLDPWEYILEDEEEQKKVHYSLEPFDKIESKKLMYVPVHKAENIFKADTEKPIAEASTKDLLLKESLNSSESKML